MMTSAMTQMPSGGCAIPGDGSCGNEKNICYKLNKYQRVAYCDHGSSFVRWLLTLVVISLKVQV